MRIYVATKWEQRERAREVMQWLRWKDHTITYDWTQAEQFSQAQAECDFDGVMAAEALVVLAEWDLPYKGTYVEFGVALAIGIPVYVVGPGFDGCIFITLPNVHRIGTVNRLLERLAEAA